MNIYNAEHYIDSTAAIAIQRVDRQRKKCEPIKKPVVYSRLTYRIGDVVALEYIDGVVRLCK